MALRSRYLWLLAFFLVAFAAIYQRMTGPTYPVRGRVEVGGDRIDFRLLRSFGGEGDADIRLQVPDVKIDGIVIFRRFRSNDEWTTRTMEREGDALVARLPHQPPAGKIMYRIGLSDGDDTRWLTDDPVILRFKGDVPAFVMIPHIVLMFLAMLFSTRAGIEAVQTTPRLAGLTLWTVVTLGVGGLFLGPVVQKYAFGAFWTGWPFGTDLTDNKTFVAFAFWAIALWRIRSRPESRGWALAASVILFLIYMIPHSVLGSELDYTQMPDSGI